MSAQPPPAPLDPRFAAFPAYLSQRARTVRLPLFQGRGGGQPDQAVPALLAHPDWTSPAPLVLWLHGRTASKELDPGRYLRWIRAGIAACAIDLPGHGERLDPAFQTPPRTLELLQQALDEIDPILDALTASPIAGLYDPDRLAIGGMSAGGMITLRRLCRPHPFRAAAVEATAGDLGAVYFNPAKPWPVPHDPARVADLDPIRFIAAPAPGWRPIPLLALHSEADEMVPIAGIRGFVEALREHYQARDADPELIELRTWPRTGAPQEHIGFGIASNEAKNLQTQFLARHLDARPPDPG